MNELGDLSLIFSRKTITIEVIDRDQYQRNETFLVHLGEPSLVREIDDPDESSTETAESMNHRDRSLSLLAMSEQEKLIAELGKPKLGERKTLRVRIRESKEFKVNHSARLPFVESRF